MNFSKTKCIEISFICIYQYLTSLELNIDFDIEKSLENLTKTKYDNIDTFIKESVLKAIKFYPEIKNLIEKHLINWTYKRVSLINKSILILGITQSKYMENIQKPIIIDTMINLAKKYSEPNDYKFINGLLDKTL